MIAGLISTVFAGFWVGIILKDLLAGQGPSGWPAIGLLVPSLPGLLVGLALLVVGSAIARNAVRAEIELSNGQLRAIERFGPLRWTRKRPIEKVEQLILDKAIRKAAITRAGSDVPVDLAPNLLVIRAQGQQMKPLFIAPGYPRSVLEALAHELADSVGAGVPAKLFDDDEPGVQVLDHSDLDEAAMAEEVERIPEQPTGSSAILDRRDGELTLTVPPAGLWRGSKGLFAFSLLWNGFMVVFTSLLLWFALSGEDDVWPLALFAIPFWAVGIGMLLAAINMGRRRAILDVVGDTLLITRAGPFGTKQQEFRADTIAAIRAGASGMEVNEVPVIELQIHPRDGKKCGLLSQRKDDELKWIAAVLRDAVGVGK